LLYRHKGLSVGIFRAIHEKADFKLGHYRVFEERRDFYTKLIAAQAQIAQYEAVDKHEDDMHRDRIPI
jgi:hypothetical protein